MITTNNYYDKVKDINFHNLPEALRKGNEYVNKATNNGASWDAYHGSDSIKKVIDMYLSKLNEYTTNNHKAAIKQHKEDHRRQSGNEVIKEAMIRQGIVNPDGTPKKKPHHKKDNVAADTSGSDNLVERIPEEVRFIRRFLNLNGKTKTKDEILRFINALQKAILEKRIRKTSAYAKEVKHIQDSLIKTFNSMKAKIKLEITDKTYNEFKQAVSAEKVYPSVQLIKKYINMNGKPGMKENAAKLIKQMENAAKKKRVTKGDAYEASLQKAYSNLKVFVADKKQKELQIEPKELNGLNGLLNGLDGFESASPSVMNSMDFADLQFSTIGLKGKWFDLIGDPSSNFTAMVFGRPKMGKSYLCIDFAGYLARNHGSVLYVAKEEGLDYTLQMKLNDKNVKHPNLYVASVLPEDLSPYDFIFLDSVNKLGLTPEGLNRLKSFNPTKSFIFIFQTTKTGNFRGANSFQHDVDVVIEVPEKGKAVQMGRFNQGGEMNIFDEYNYAA